MKTKNLVSVLIAVVLVAGVAGAGYYGLFSAQDKAGNTLADNTFGWKYPVAKFPKTGPGGLAYSDIRDPGGIPQGLPVRLNIPSIGVDSAVEDALITPDGRMDVPSGSVDVAWFALGPHPGSTGSAVIGGHFGINNGVKFVFYDLDKLKVGDKVYIVDDKHDTLAFVVRSIKLFDRNADATTVFTSEDGLAHLNLITCEGTWNQVNGSYPQRRVVFTDFVAGSATAPAATPAATPVASVNFTRTFGVGASGFDVVALQTILEKKGLLTMPQGVQKGLFGGLTRVAVAKYQTSVGLSPVGAFGPLTRAKLNAELSNTAVLPNTGTEVVAIPGGKENPPAPHKTLLESAQTLYATPLDALITLILFIAILFIGFKIIRR